MCIIFHVLISFLWKCWICVHTYTLCAETLCVSTASTSAGTGWRQESSFCFRHCRHLQAASHSRGRAHSFTFQNIGMSFLKLSEISQFFLRNCLELPETSQIFMRNCLNFLTLSSTFEQSGVTYPSTLDGSRLKIIFRSVESDSKSTSETKKTRLQFLRKFSRNLRKLSIEYSDFLRKKTCFSKKLQKKV